MAKTLTGKKIVVIGGSAGIGFGVAKHSLLNLASEIIIVSSTKPRVDKALATMQEIIAEYKLPGKVQGEVCDAGDAKAVRTLFKEIGELDHIVWTAGKAERMDLYEQDLEKHRSAFDVKFWGVVAAVQGAKFLPGGSLTLTIGTSAIKPRKGWSLIGGMLGSVEALTRGLAVDLAPIRVNVVAPGWVNTELWTDAEFSQGAVAEMIKTREEKLLVRHVADGDEIAEAFLFCMRCEYLTGQRIEVDGGQTLVSGL
ncbi:short-chain dehydrogenase/reductase SDR [Schizopora paradoxa]|uniref:Short-chain dehydrogenase/reductase SDR n=1 Tax=Schizopora paradoxa TaxID=27342 RepID=A0A0H2SB21_9AGAM|nr:short-chain dehydrogenase/reductase SDR [Schizopora paradoxa]